MKIDVNTKINDYLSFMEESNTYDEMNIKGLKNIDEYMKRFNGGISNLTYSPLELDKLNIKAFENFEILRTNNSGCEILMIVSDNQIIFKSISIIGIPKYKIICDGVVLKEESKGSFKDTDIYVNDEHIIRNRVTRDEKGDIIVEIYSSDLENDDKLSNLLNFNNSLNISYHNEMPDQISIKLYNQLLEIGYISEQIGFDLKSNSGKIRAIMEINSVVNTLITQLDNEYLRKKDYCKTK